MGKIAQDNAKIRVFLHEPRKIAQGAFAIAAIIIKEFDQGDLAVRIADHGLIGAAKEHARGVRDDLLARLGLRGLIARFEHTDRFTQDFRLLQQIILDNRLLSRLSDLAKTLPRGARDQGCKREKAKRQRSQASSAIEAATRVAMTAPAAV